MAASKLSDQAIQRALESFDFEIYKYMVELMASKLAVARRMTSDGVPGEVVEAFISAKYPNQPF
eukprot:scaffold183423_cov39-Prasinocladus_malaysianus.AAC.1